ncbi:hypothetical protein RHS04_06104 [Rhizoctonia solani]|uniref:F-box domain-containing protein n=1 Tax=Rhizoctonia solani TaxID=456999 RepID=A0A8H7LG89_9AGAM|nr:hypothetical protein RHS04_06104 [Rhizoctonia solani]
MPALTRSQTSATRMAAAPKGERAAKRGAVNKPEPNPESKSKSKDKVPPKKKSRIEESHPDEEPNSKLVFQPTVLPLELFLEIARYISPLDLIHLSRAARVFHSAFMSRSTADVWRATFANAGVPPCPDETMAEPRYAALMALEPHEVGYYGDLIPRSIFIVPLYPGRKAERPERFHREQHRKVAEKKEEFIRARDYDGWDAWVDERKKFVRAWYEKTSGLVKWVRKLECEYEQELQRLQDVRIEGIKSRLIKLGWCRADIQLASGYSNRWKTLFNRIKPLDEKDWNKHLPHLLRDLESARKNRLRLEAHKRYQQRQKSIKDWFTSKPAINVYIKLCWKDKDSHMESEIGLERKPIKSLHSEVVGKQQDYVLEIRSYPVDPFRYLCTPYKIHGASHITDLISCDQPMDKFWTDFTNKRVDIVEQLYKGRVCIIQEDLIKKIPDDLVPVDVQTPSFYLQGHIGSGDTSIPDDPLSTNLRKLLRADVVLKKEDKSMYYPEGLDAWTLEVFRSSVRYDPELSKIAKALLNTLQHPNACYLEMRTLGKVFLCGRCTREPHYHTWNGILDHYMREYGVHEHVCKKNKNASESGKEIEIVFRHDTDRIDDENPLVHVVPIAKQEPVPTTGTIVSMSRCT